MTTFGGNLICAVEVFHHNILNNEAKKTKNIHSQKENNSTISTLIPHIFHKSFAKFGLEEAGGNISGLLNT
jgi:hypothetical protein